ncbi:MAG: hypothetical protein L6R28_20665 [Planctomycetes bacterium]|nr:hypothetical protein [Planctomycetota bacterium]
MSINETFLLLKSADFAGAAEAIEAALRRWLKEVFPGLTPGLDDPAPWGLDPQWRKALLLVPPEDGWMLLLDTVRESDLSELAERLSVHLHGTAVSVKVEGRRYAWQYRIFDCGREVRAFERPEAAALAAPGAGEAPMPQYSDVEAEAYAFLAELGVPPALRLIGFAELLHPPTLAGRARREGFLWRYTGLRGGVPQVARQAAELLVPPRRAVVPVRLDAANVRPDGRRVHEEFRDLSGTPDPEALDALLAVELDVRNRYAYAHLKLPDGDAPEVVFRYRHPLLSEAELARRLAVRRRVFERARPDQRAFLRAALATMRKRWPQYRVGKRQGFGFELFPPAPEASGPREFAPGEVDRPRQAPTPTAWLVRLDNVYERFRAYTGPLSPSAYLARFFERAIETLTASLPTTWEDARPHVLPRLWGGGEDRMPADHGPEMPMRSVAPGLRAGLVCERGEGLLHVGAPALRAWQVDFETAFDQALAALEARTPKGLQGAELHESRTQDGGRVVTVQYGDGNTSARALSRTFRQDLLALLGEDAAVVSFPDRDAIRAAPASDPFGIEALQTSARRRAGDGLGAELFRLTADALAPYASL